MAEPTHHSRPKVTLEQLIQLKRTERPPAEFWTDFDRELHRRQLVALVTIEPWYRRAGSLLAATARRMAPIGASAAALALAVFAMLRVDSTDRPTGESVAATTVADAEARFIELPEEAISVSAPPAPQVAVIVEEFSGDVHTAPLEVGTGAMPARRFVTVSAPVTFSSGDDSSAIYAAKALTAGAVLRSLAAAAPESL